MPKKILAFFLITIVSGMFQQAFATNYCSDFKGKWKGYGTHTICTWKVKAKGSVVGDEYRLHVKVYDGDNGGTSTECTESTFDMVGTCDDNLLKLDDFKGSMDKNSMELHDHRGAYLNLHKKK